MARLTRSLLVMALIVAVVSAIDAVAGRALQASPKLNLLLALGVVAWVTFRRAMAGDVRYSISAGVGAWLLYVGAYALWATLLIGWNGSVTWTARGEWLLGWTGAAIVVSAFGRALGARARARRMGLGDPVA